jgi:uncharacterized protein YdaU (DUF1376 family)
MNFYGFHIGDYASKTRHLSWEEDLAYRRLLDVYYGAEKPLPVEKKAIYRLVVAMTTKHRQAVDTVLSEFFVLLSDGWHNLRCDDELAAHASKRDKARQSAEARWGKPDAVHSQSDRNATASSGAMRSHSEGNAPTPTTHSHSQSQKESGGVVRARGDLSSADLEALLRKAAGWEAESAPGLFITGPIEALLSNGADLELDVLPVVRAIAPQASSRSTWKYFVKAIARARDDRVSASTVVSPSNPSRSANGKRTSPSAKLGLTDFVLGTLGGEPGEGEGDPRDAEPGH